MKNQAINIAEIIYYKDVFSKESIGVKKEY